MYSNLRENDLADAFIDVIYNFDCNNNQRQSWWEFGDTFYRRGDSLATKVFIHVLIHSCVFRSIYVGRPYFQVSFNESQAYLGHFSLKLNIHQRIVSSPRNELLPVLCSGSSSLFLCFNPFCGPTDTPFCHTLLFSIPHGSQTFGQPFWASLISARMQRACWWGVDSLRILESTACSEEHALSKKLFVPCKQS